MTLSFEEPFLVMSKSGKILCRVRIDDTDLGELERLPDFVTRHGGIDATLDYMLAVSTAGLPKHMRYKPATP